MKLNCIIIFLIVGIFPLTAQEHAWVYFNDKPQADTYLANPQSMLSQRALARKNLHQTPIDVRDVPVEESYVTTIKNQTGISVKATSKWFNCVHVIGDINTINALINFNFVDKIVFVNKNISPVTSKINKRDYTRLTKSVENQEEVYTYGNAQEQVEMLNAHVLHENNYAGENIHIAVIDGGFSGVTSIAAFSELRNQNRLLGGYDFVEKSNNYWLPAGDHGTKVLATIAGNIPNQYVGTAPKASYYLFRTEDGNAETPVEESYWVEAIERADSLGVNVINTSLGYSIYDNSAYSYTPSDMDGQTAFCSKAANIATEKGMLVVVSAGNSGNNSSFPNISAPADANVLTVGAVDSNETYANFSSIGSTADGRIKPDVMAKGVSTAVINANNTIVTNNGTSFSAPIIAGAAACLWQANPSKTAEELMQIIKASSSRYNQPDNFYGYGIPDFSLALNTVLNTTKNKTNTSLVYPNPTNNFIQINTPYAFNYKIYNTQGKLIVKRKRVQKKIDVSNFTQGIYILHLEIEKQNFIHKIIKY